MNQATLELSTVQAPPHDRAGFDIGWDHAHHGLAPPAEWLHPDTPVCQGWTAAKAVFGRRVLPSRRSTRQWLALRLQAWCEGVDFDGQLVTANYLGQLHNGHCPVLRTTLGGAAGSPDAAVIERIHPDAGYVAGNLVVMSARAAAVRKDVSLQQAVRRARQCELSGETVHELDAASWWRLAALAACAQTLPFAEVARLPLALMPPNRVRLVNAVQGLQALITQMFASPGWSGRCQAVAQLLPEHTLRLDFNLFVGAMAPRVLEADSQPAARRLALEDAWLQERVQRRWLHLVLSLGETGVQALLDRAVQSHLPGVPGIRVVQHSVAPVRCLVLKRVAARPAAAPARTRAPAVAPAVALASAQAPAPSRPASRPGTVQPPAGPARHG